MKIVFDTSFYKSLDRVPLNSLKKKINSIILNVENAKSVRDISNIKKLQGFKTYYRIKIGDYRLGFELESTDVVRFIIICHRKDIYNKFP